MRREEGETSTVMDRTPIVICANHAGFGGAYNLNEAINSYSRLFRSSLVVASAAPYGFGDGLFPKNEFERVDQLFESTELFFICDYQGLSVVAQYLSVREGKEITHSFQDADGVKSILRWLGRKKLIFFWSGTRFMMNSQVVLSWVSQLDCRTTFAMPELLRFDERASPLYQPFDLPVSAAKYVTFTVCHSPGKKIMYRKGQYGKGTDTIERAFRRLKRRLGGDYIIVTGLPYSEAIVTKARSHAFVDQIMPRIGGIGKSGLEAIAMGVPTLGDIRFCNPGGQYAGFPVIPVRNARELYSQLKRLFLDPAYLETARATCLQWRHKLSFKETAAYLDRSMVW